MNLKIFTKNIEEKAINQINELLEQETFKNSKVLKEIVKELTIDNFLLETDSPYLTPSLYRGEDNSPKYIPIIANEIASIKGISNKEVAVTTTANAEATFDFF